ncbi:MAG: reverse transcriptase domain-containing protein, partial [Candidatus Fonsibacter sp.]
MNENILEMDYHAKLASLDLQCPVLILFDFKAAFPSVHHDFMWSVLEALAIPQKWRRMIALFYRNNFQKVGRGEGLGFLAEVGIRQGCPLSPLIFAVIADVLLRTLHNRMANRI